MENVIERAVITSSGGRLNLSRALPEAVPALEVEAAEGPVNGVHTVEEWEAMERRNLERALELCAGKVSGEQGAARLLGMNPSTLASRLKALGVKARRDA